MKKTTTEPGKQAVNKNDREIAMIKFQMEQVQKWLDQIHENHENHEKVKDEKVYQANLAAAHEKMSEWKDKLSKLKEDNSKSNEDGGNQ